MNHSSHKILATLLLVPIAVLFLSCCCLKAEASTAKKSACSSCPKKENSEHHSSENCPHAKIKAIADNANGDLLFTKNLAPVFVLSLKPFVIIFNAKSYAVAQLTAPPLHPSLYFQNPILRV